MECPQRSAETYDSIYNKRHLLSLHNLIVTEYLETIAVAQFDSHRVSRQTDLGFRRETPDIRVDRSSSSSRSP